MHAPERERAGMAGMASSSSRILSARAVANEKGRGVRGTRRLDPNLYGSRSASRARWLWPPLRPDESGASGEAQALSRREARPSVGPRVPQPTTRTGLAFPARAPIPPHVTTPRERAPRVDGTAGEKHILGHLSSGFANGHG